MHAYTIEFFGLYKTHCIKAYGFEYIDVPG